MNLEIAISIPDLWGEQIFQKNEWSSINYLVGPNATGKTRFVEELNKQCKNQGLKVRYLSSERLFGLERKRYDLFGHTALNQGFDFRVFQEYKRQGLEFGLAGDAFPILKEKIDIKIKIEATLSQLFSRKIRLAEEGGFLNPKIQKTEAGNEYSLRESECHGLKELITLLTFLYDDDYNCLIIDEPELHLHPQFQTFFIQEIRKIAGDPQSTPGRKCFFIVTHSPYFIDIRTIEDLKYCFVFQPDKLPTCIDQLEGEDELRIKHLLPRLNTHHKQFFFATRPVFVEGYSDQQIFGFLQDKRGKLLGASGSCIIDVGGKDELDLFFRLCKKLNIDAQFIADLDTVFQGRLRQSISYDDRCTSYVNEKGLGENLIKAIGEIERKISECLDELEPKLGNLSESDSLQKYFKSSLSKENRIEKKRYIFLLGLNYIREKIEALIPGNKYKISFIKGKIKHIIQASKCVGVYILSKGMLENYLPEYNGNPYIISDKTKSKAFEKERDFILKNDLTERQNRARYGELINILDEAMRIKEINMDSFINLTICDLIYNVQIAFRQGGIKNEDSLKGNATVDWQTYSRIFDLIEFSLIEGGFTCKIKLKSLLDPREREFEFDDKVSATKFQLGEN
ncbi:MAG: AAA family ATPase [Candidatus Aminicenantes bacterium]|nr:AAA family ATPase [Candidatus Aminicenantes bacterium]